MTSILVILPLLCAWPLCFLVIRILSSRRAANLDWRLTWLAACLGFGTILTVVVELCSVFHSLNRTTLVTFWLVVDLVLLIAWLKGRPRKNCASEIDDEPRDSSAPRSSEPWPLDARFLMGASILVVITLFLIALLTPTTNGDSLSYHLARMAHWIQQQSVDHFPTDDTRQLEFGPWSSFAMTSLFLLWGNDRLLNLVQWFAMISSVIALTWLVEQLQNLYRRDRPLPGDDKSGQKRLLMLTCVLAVALPIGIVESISTQNDYTTALWLLSLFAFAFCLFRKPWNGWYFAGAGTACGLGVLTKATTYIYAAPLIVTGVVWWLWNATKKTNAEIENGRLNLSTRMQLIGLFVLPFLLLNVSHWMRNYSLFHSPLGSSEILALERNSKMTPAVAASNALRNLALHANSGIPLLTHGLNRITEKAHGLLGMDLNDAASTYENCPFQFQERFVVFDSGASCTFHVLLALGTLGWLFVHWKRYRALRLYTALLLAGGVLFCVLLKWQPWHSRLHLAWLLLLVPVMALVVSELPRAAATAISLIALVVAGTTIVSNASRPIFNTAFWNLTREQQYLALHDHDLTQPLRHLADKLAASHCETIGLKADFCGIEYPLWVMLRNRGFHGRFYRCHVTHPSRQLEKAETNPDVIVTVFNRIPEPVIRAYPYSEKYGRLTALWSRDMSGAIEHAQATKD